MPPSSEPPHVGSVLADRYELVRHIARGGMGDVYEGEDRLLQRPVAVKVFRAASPADRDRFDSEIRVLASLNHPGLVRVFDAGPHGDDAFLVLELIDGPPLSSSLADGATLPPVSVADIGRQVADALAYIHAHGVVHRDVTPANVLCDLDEGRPRLVDFGIIRLLDSPRVTSASIAIGTAAYMAPEQVEGKDVTPAADVYALGMVLLQALTGRREYTGTMQEVAVARLVRDPDTTTGVPPVFQPLLAQMCARDPAERPSAEEVRDRLAVIAGDEDATVAVPVPVATGPATAVLPAMTASAAPALAAAAARQRQRRRTSGLIAAAGVAAAVVVALLLTAADGDEPPAAPATSTTATSAAADQGADGDSSERQAPVDTATPTTTTVAEEPTTTTPTTVPRSVPLPPTTLAPTTTAAPPTTATPATVAAPATDGAP